MKVRSLIAILGLAAFGYACADTGHYPVTGVTSSPTDPVQGLSVRQLAKAA